MNKKAVFLALFLFTFPSNASAIYPYDCYGLNVASAPTCGVISTAGCCDGAGRTVWCQDGELFCINCAAQGNTCGWDVDNEFYDCGQVGEDPLGWEPYDCFDSCVPDCTGRSCGSDGCGGSCGACDGARVCIDGQCYDTPPACNGPSVPVGSECGDINYIGCCDSTGKTLWCDGAALYCIDCVGLGNPSCGWNAEYGSYDCATDGSEDPSGVYPLNCGPAPCVADCYLKSCGDDGCGGSCGTCNANQFCNGSSQCETVACVPACTGKYCGPNGCGGTCGECASTEECTAEGKCQLIPCDPTCTGKECGGDGCGGSCGQCSADSSCVYGLCVCDIPCDSGCCAAGSVCFDASCCVPKCSDRECGNDGCGGQCGVCEGEETCNQYGVCEAPPCVPLCDGKECGDDGCGLECGTCGAYSACVSGKCLCEFNCAGNCCAPDATCVAGQCCTPDCTGKECGDNGCGGQCGTCGSELSCVEGVCVAEVPVEPTPDVVSPDTHEEDVAAEEIATPDVAMPDALDSVAIDLTEELAQGDTQGKDSTHDTGSSVDQESDHGNTIVVPTEDIGSTEKKTITTGCTAQADPAQPSALLLLLALLLALPLLRFRLPS